MRTVTNRLLILSLVLVAGAPRLAPAQQPSVTPEQQAAILQAGRLLNDPATFVLQHRTELGLTAEQVASVEKLAAALRDSAAARMAARTREAQQMGRVKGVTSAMEWTGPINEKAIREAMRKQSEVTAEIMIASARDRRAVAALLTATQREQLPKLQTAEMMKAARAGR
jgi:alanyl-tRNA synthetase